MSDTTGEAGPDPDDGDAAERADDDAAVDGADAAESGYRRDDYWRQQQQGLPPDAGAEWHERDD